MAKDLATRIAERNRTAEAHMREQNWFGRTTSKIGLTLANTVDSLTGWMNDDRVVFFGATAAGLTRGAIYGGIIAIFAIAISASVAAVAIPAFLGAAAIGAVVFGIHDGQQKLEEHIDNGSRGLADSIARISGAVPAPLREVANHKGEDPEVTADLERRYEAAMPPAAQGASFTAREDSKRVAATVQQRG